MKESNNSDKSDKAPRSQNTPSGAGGGGKTLFEKIFRPQQVAAAANYNVPTLHLHLPIKNELSRNQVQQLTGNCASHAIELYDLSDLFRGIVPVTVKHVSKLSVT